MKTIPGIATSILIFAGLAVLSTGATAQQVPTKADAETLLKAWESTKLIEDKAFEPFRPLGAKALELFAPYLTDKELGTFAEFAMQKLDPIASTPYLLKVLPLKDGNTQSNAIRAANRAMMEFGWFERAGKPEPKYVGPEPRFPRNTNPYPYAKEMHDVAVAIVSDKSRSGPVRNALLTIGLTGSRKDFTILNEFAAHEAGDNFEVSDRHTALAALARLGDKKALDFITSELKKAVKTKPAEPYSHDGVNFVKPADGAIVVTREEAQRLRSVIGMAAFSMNRRFVPLLIQHLDDPYGQSYGDYRDPDPKFEACMALGQIAQGMENLRPVDYWKSWWTEQNKR